jgi:aminoglycoside phosphotransferase
MRKTGWHAATRADAADEVVLHEDRDEQDRSQSAPAAGCLRALTCPCRGSPADPRTGLVLRDLSRIHEPSFRVVPGLSRQRVLSGCAAHELSPRRHASGAGGLSARMAGVEEVEVVVAHSQRVTLRVGEVFLKVDGDPAHADAEVRAMAMAPIPTPAILWREPPVLAIAAVSGTALGRLGRPSAASPAAWAAAGVVIRRLHDAPLPPWPGPKLDDVAAKLDSECAWLLANAVLPAEVILRNREIAEAALRLWVPVFMHGDLQITHVFVDGDEVTGVIDWSEAAPGDAMFDLATLTLGHEERLDDLLAGYGPGADRDVIRAWWSLRSLLASHWLLEHGFDPDAPGCEFDVLRSRMQKPWKGAPSA